MGITGVHHFSITVTDVERTVEFYTKLLGAECQFIKTNKYDSLGEALFGAKWGVNQKAAELRIGVIQLGGTRMEFIQYIDPPVSEYHKNPSVAGSSHIAIQTDDIDKDKARLEAAGVEFHSPINVLSEEGKSDWKWVYFRDPDGICLELVEQPD